LSLIKSKIESIEKIKNRIMRQYIVAGNWKMNKTLEEGTQLVQSLVEKIKNPKALVVLGVPYTHLQGVAQQIKGHKNMHVAAQNCHEAEKGAYTGEISTDMIVSTGAEFVIIGHSERRQYFKESNEVLAQKVNICLQKSLRPIFCCGEPLNIREKGTQVNFVAKQIKASLFHLEEADFRKIVIAYEPIWAIGTGVTASTQQAQDMHEALRKVVARKYGKRVAKDCSILYGGSCNAQNAKELFGQPDVDGGLIGGASLKADDFVAIIESV
jgi:triosephosphate isomerase (TIM)